MGMGVDDQLSGLKKPPFLMNETSFVAPHQATIIGFQTKMD